jgi:hypothetical protein
MRPKRICNKLNNPVVGIIVHKKSGTVAITLIFVVALGGVSRGYHILVIVNIINGEIANRNRH